ncbi:glycoside hydrolase family 15 protein [Arthrobacter crystallopoietes]|uniref:Glucoamylase (Glucan-1,4-alpha-glucosidase), GH15 family n=1 Tax=Crystallibacter crystallopoietes TaxID=37928 RepID=A0A1H1DQ90_9MICC|nr:glycoside hydrolase family 15 protein [Arthrobacter crystallopoietes]AUI50209.1 glycoside hydrolase family 15 [Arthrobacter crystallopoietes]SDQ78701.1 Glucoamylase (glucan-1,4-alpha-glucosidase), GH15 family [Arthrobacter crystallopoietes]
MEAAQRSTENTRQPDIGDYGLIGDTRTAALVSGTGAIDWMCVPSFDGEPVFGRLVGGSEAGTFRLGPATPAAPTQRRYRPETATLETTWTVGEGTLVLTDAMVAEVRGQLLPATLLVRRLMAVGQPVQAVVEFDPRLGERHVRPRVRSGPSLVCEWGQLALSLGSDPELSFETGTPASFLVTPGHPVTLVLAVAYGEPLVHVEPDAAVELLAADEELWRAWAAEIDGGTPYRGAVVRSLLTLRLLTYSPSGAPVAAPTTSLPEFPGGIRNWDYRYAWPRDASIGVGAFLGVGKAGEARSFLRWLLHASRLERPRLPAMLTLTGRHVPPERTLAGWPGYADSTPVRVGNGAATQHQLDGYGWVLDGAWVLVEAGHKLYSETWRAMRGFADLVARRWQEPDAGIWEIRDDAAHHVHSKMMGWLALDRALNIGRTHRVSQRQQQRWQVARDALAAEIRLRGFDPEGNTYTRSYGSTDLDAAVLILPLLGIEEPGSERTRGTVDAIRSKLSAGGPLLYRYPPGRDGLPGTEGAFLPCSFWLVQALAETGRRAEAAQLFEEMLGLANDLGLFAEEMDPQTHAQLGNFPQALTHAALVQAALALRESEG